MTTANEVTTRPVGRPSKYDPSFCERVIELGRLGKSRVSIACELDVCLASLERWEEEYPEFRGAMERARQFAQHWWEEKGVEGMLAGPGSFNAAIWSRSMAARFPETWREKRIRVDIPDVVDNSTLIQAQARVSAAIANGKLDTEGGAMLSKLLTDLGTSMERLEIEKRLAAIEERLGSRR